MDQEDIHVLIERYLQNELSEEESRAFEKRLLDDETFAAEVMMYQKMRLALEVEGEELLRNELSALGDSLRMEQGPATRSKKLWNQPWVYAVAAAAAIALFFLIRGAPDDLAPPTSADQLFAQYMDAPPMSPQRGESTDSLMQLAYMAYMNGEDSLARKQLIQVVDIDSTHIVAIFYLGVTQLKLGEASQAIASFKKVPPVHGYFQRARWYMALSYLKQKDLSTTANLLSQMLSEGQKYKKDETEDLLELIERLTYR